MDEYRRIVNNLCIGLIRYSHFYSCRVHLNSAIQIFKTESSFGMVTGATQGAGRRLTLFVYVEH